MGVAEHCPDCISFAAEGWQPIGHFPTPCDGSTQCLVNCQCHKEYRKARGSGRRGHVTWPTDEGLTRAQVIGKAVGDHLVADPTSRVMEFAAHGQS